MQMDVLREGLGEDPREGELMEDSRTDTTSAAVGQSWVTRVWCSGCLIDETHSVVFLNCILTCIFVILYGFISLY